MQGASDTMYKVILVAIDGSDTTRDALHAAVNLAEKHNAKLFILHVADESYLYRGGLCIDCCAQIELIRKEGKKILTCAKKVLAKHQSVDYTTILIELRSVHERVAEIIIGQAQELNANVIVVGSHGRRGFSRLFLGSVAERVIRLTEIPVLLIKGNSVT